MASLQRSLAQAATLLLCSCKKSTHLDHAIRFSTGTRVKPTRPTFSFTSPAAPRRAQSKSSSLAIWHAVACQGSGHSRPPHLQSPKGHVLQTTGREIVSRTLTAAPPPTLTQLSPFHLVSTRHQPLSRWAFSLRRSPRPAPRRRAQTCTRLLRPRGLIRRTHASSTRQRAARVSGLATPGSPTSS